MGNDKHRNALVSGTELLWYRIERVLGQGAFGITYLGHDINLDRKVAIKEYLPAQLCLREASLSVQPLSDEHSEDFKFGLERFITEARVLTKFEHPNLIRVFNVFEANNTAYMVMNYEEGQSLQSYAKQKHKFTEKELIRIILPLMNGLSSMHAQGFIHRDIKPGNIFIRGDGSPVLLDFGSARQTRQQNPMTLTNFVSPGYAPIEQYASKSDKQGPWTDIYGFGATLYRVITGAAPVNAIDRSEMLTHDNKDCYIPLAASQPDEYRQQFLKAIDQSLAFRAQDRPQSIKDWYELFDFDEEEIETQPVLVPVVDTSTFHVDTDAATETVPVQDNDTYITRKNESATIDLYGEQATVKTGNTKKSINKKLLAGISSLVLMVLLAGILLIPDKNKIDDEQTIVGDISSGEEQEQTQETLSETEPVMNPPETSSDLSETIPVEEINRLLKRAEENIEQFKLTSPKDDNAYDLYLQVLALDLENESARAGIRAISDRYISLSYSAIDRHEFERARLYINKAEEIWPESDKVFAANKKYQIELDKYEHARQESDTNPEEESPVVTRKENTDTEEQGVFSDVKKWFKETAEKNKDVKKEETAEDRVKRSLGGQ